MINNNKQAQIDRMNEQLNDLLGPKPTEEKGTREMFESMEAGDVTVIDFKFKSFGMEKVRSLEIRAYESVGEVKLSIRASDNMLGSMNVDKITGTRLKAYSYDMMSQKTTYDFRFEDMIRVVRV